MKKILEIVVSHFCNLTNHHRSSVCVLKQEKLG